MDKYIAEALVGQNVLQLGEDKIIYITATGDVDGAGALEIEKLYFELKAAAHGHIAGILVDLSKAGKSSQEARKVWTKLSSTEGATPVAFFGSHPVARVVASFIIKFSNNKKMNFFKDRGSALQWIKSQIKKTSAE